MNEEEDYKPFVLTKEGLEAKVHSKVILEDGLRKLVLRQSFVGDKLTTSLVVMEDNRVKTNTPCPSRAIEVFNSIPY